MDYCLNSTFLFEFKQILFTEDNFDGVFTLKKGKMIFNQEVFDFEFKFFRTEVVKIWHELKDEKEQRDQK